jgi:hypothetical protein
MVDSKPRQEWDFAKGIPSQAQSALKVLGYVYER